MLRLNWFMSHQGLCRDWHIWGMSRKGRLSEISRQRWAPPAQWLPEKPMNNRQEMFWMQKPQGAMVIMEGEFGSVTKPTPWLQNFTQHVVRVECTIFTKTLNLPSKAPGNQEMISHFITWSPSEFPCSTLFLVWFCLLPTYSDWISHCLC